MGMARPRKHTQIGVFTKAIDVYFEDAGVPSKAGLRSCLRLSRDAYNEYKKRGDEFSDALKRAEDRIEIWWVGRLPHQHATGAIFYLKNAFSEDYRDRHELTGSGGESLFKPDPATQTLVNSALEKYLGGR